MDTWLSIRLLLVVWNPFCLDPSNGVFRRFRPSCPLRLPHLKYLLSYVIMAAEAWKHYGCRSMDVSSLGVPEEAEAPYSLF